MYSNEVADDAVASAKSLKDGGATTIYTIGIFGGADPTQMYGTGGESGTPGEVGYEWSAKRVLFCGDVSKAEVGAANRFLNLLSSNYPDATDDGLYHDNDDWLVYEKESFETLSLTYLMYMN